ncbi:kielin/chordin-like protein, partial [Saccoglossus kowalevskii]
MCNKQLLLLFVFNLVNGKKQSYECHNAGGCCRPYSCEVDEIELPYNCSSNCKCCIPHQDEKTTCHDGKGHVGICKETRIDDNTGCYTHSKICWRDSRCNRHVMCFIPYMQHYGYLDDACKSQSPGAHCLAPHEKCFGYIMQDICPCNYGCCIPTIEEICPSPNYCSYEGAHCPGLFIESAVCGEYMGCCYVSADDSKCTNISTLGGLNGICQYDNTSCDGWYVSKKCAGPPNRRCCKPNTPGADSPCTHYPGARCLNIKKNPCPDGDYRSGLCDPDGPMKRQCCMPGCLEKQINETTGKMERSPCYLAGGCCRPLYCEGREEPISEPCFHNETLPGLPSCKCCKIFGDRGGNLFGDPHFDTLDHKSFQFDGHCSYVLLRECKKPLHTPRFTIINKHGLMESLKGKLKAYVFKITVVIQLSSKKYFKAELLESKYVS